MNNSLLVTTPSELEILVTRSFNAPRQLVWNAMCQPEFLRRWLFCPPGWAMTVCEMDVRVGGAYHWAWSGPDGKIALTLWGLYREVIAPRRIVHTQRMAMGPMGCPTSGHTPDPGSDFEILATMDLTEQGAGTLLKLNLLYPSRQARDGAKASGMERGMSLGYLNLDAIFANQSK